MGKGYIMFKFSNKEKTVFAVYVLFILICAYCIYFLSFMWANYQFQEQYQSNKIFIDYVYKHNCYVDGYVDAYEGRVSKTWVCLN